MIEKPEFEPKDHIDAYLNTDLNIEIFEELTEDERHIGLFEPLVFFNMLYKNFELVKVNKDKPTTTVEYLMNLDLSKNQLHYLLRYLREFLIRIKNDEQIGICVIFMQKEFNKLNTELTGLHVETTVQKAVSKTAKYKFDQVKQKLETLPDTKARINYLFDIKTEYLQNKDGLEWDMGTPFDEQCQLEIDKLKQQLQLDKSSQSDGNNIQPIWWRSSGRLLRYLFDELTKHDLIDRNSPVNKHIKEHFINKDKEPFTDSIKQNSSGVGLNKSGKPRGHKKVDAIIKGLKEQSD